MNILASSSRHKAEYLFLFILLVSSGNMLLFIILTDVPSRFSCCMYSSSINNFACRVWDHPCNLYQVCLLLDLSCTVMDCNVLLSQCCWCSACEWQKAQDTPCSSPGCQEPQQLHFHHCSTSLAPHDAATKAETSLFPNSITFSGREAVPSGMFCEHVTSHQDMQEVCSTGHFCHAWIQGSLMLLHFTCWGSLGNNDNLKINNFDTWVSSLG